MTSLDHRTRRGTTMRELIKTRRYKAGYEIRYEQMSGDEAGGGSAFIMRSAFTIPEGYYIGIRDGLTGSSSREASSPSRGNPQGPARMVAGGGLAASASASVSRSGTRGRCGVVGTRGETSRRIELLRRHPSREVLAVIGIASSNLATAHSKRDISKEEACF